MQNEEITLSPSSLTFLFEECPRCFYEQVVMKRRRPSAPFPKVFTLMDQQQKACFLGLPADTFDPALPSGRIMPGPKVVSGPIAVSGHQTRIRFHGQIDTLLRFHDGTIGIADFKTAEPRFEHVEFYGRQLHAYAWASENPALLRYAHGTVTRLGLVCFPPEGMVSLPAGGYAYLTRPVWVGVERDDEAFMAFLGNVLEVVEAETPPLPDPSCGWCSHASGHPAA